MQVRGIPIRAPKGVAVTDLIAAALVELTEGSEVKSTITELADTLRLQLGMN